MRTLLGIILGFSIAFVALDASARRPIEKVIAEHQKEWMEIRGVNGVGQTLKRGKPAIMIMVEKLTTELKVRLPKKVEGYAVVIEVVGLVTPIEK